MEDTKTGAIGIQLPPTCGDRAMPAAKMSRNDREKIAEATGDYKAAQSECLLIRAELAKAQADVATARAAAMAKRTELDKANAARKSAKAVLDAVRAQVKAKADAAK